MPAPGSTRARRAPGWSPERRRRFLRRALPAACAVVLAAGAGTAVGVSSQGSAGEPPPAAEPTRTVALPPPPASSARAEPAASPAPAPPRPRADQATRIARPATKELPVTATPVHWRASRAVGKPFAGRLQAAVQLPPSGRHFITWDGPVGRSPSRGWRRYGTARLIRVVLKVAAAYRAAHPEAARLVIGDLSRPRGGPFGPEYGGLGHRSHQNGLDIDVFYPRRDGQERPPARLADIDRALAQDLVRRFTAAGAQYVFVGPRTGLRGRRGVVIPLVHHDRHLHVRIRPGPGARG